MKSNNPRFRTYFEMHCVYLVAVGRKPSGASKSNILNPYRAACAAPLRVSKRGLTGHIFVLLLASTLLMGCSPTASQSPTAQSAPEVESPETSAVTSQTQPEATPMRLTDDAFRFAAYEGKIDSVREGLKAGNNVNATDPERRLTPLHMAAYNGHVEVIKLLLEHGATLDVRDIEGKTPLLHASTGPYAEAIKVLIAAGADVNAAEATEAFTPLMMAAGLGQTEVVKILLAHKANRDLLDNDGDSALKHAQNSGHLDIVELLKQ